eukprot:6016678-Amphidinium_carterae.1
MQAHTRIHNTDTHKVRHVNKAVVGRGRKYPYVRDTHKLSETAQQQVIQFGHRNLLRQWKRGRIGEALYCERAVGDKLGPGLDFKEDVCGRISRSEGGMQLCRVQGWRAVLAMISCARLPSQN